MTQTAPPPGPKSVPPMPGGPANDPMEILAMRKARLVSRLTLGSVALVTVTAFAFLALTGTEYDPAAMMASQMPEKGYDWDGVADALPPLPEKPTGIFFVEGPDPLFPSANQQEEDTTPEVGEIEPVAGMGAAEIAQQSAKVKRLIEQGDRFFKSNRFQDAEDVYMEAVKIQESLKAPLGEKFYERAKSYERQRSWSRAKLLFRMSLHFDYRNPRYHEALARTSRALGDKKKAAEHERLAAKFAAS